MESAAYVWKHGSLFCPRSNRASWTGSLLPSSSARRQSWPSDLCVPSLPEESLPTGSALISRTKERAALPGMLTEANRLTGGTSSSQRQLEHLTPEITRWWKANERIFLTETKTTGHHQNPVHPPQRVLDTPTCPKARLRFKIISHDGGRRF